MKVVFQELKNHQKPKFDKFCKGGVTQPLLTLATHHK